MKKNIQHNKPTINKKEISAVIKVLKSGWIAQGSEVKKFENEFCRFLGYKSGHAVAFSSGTAVLYVALISLGVGPKDEVIIPTYVCSAVLNAIFMTGAKPVLVDINKDDLNISFSKTKKKISKNTKAIIITHTFGMPADIDRFITLRVPIIEDCAQAIGAKYNGRNIGIFGKAAIFSFYASKVLTTGYGGIVFSKDKNFIKRVKDYREFDCRKKYKPRFNFQMSDLHAAIGKVQFKKLPLFLKKRKKIANEYYKALSADRVWPLLDSEARKPNFFRFLVRYKNPQKLKIFLEKRDVKTIIPIETHELLHRYLGQKSTNFLVSERVAKTTLSIPIYPALTISEINKIKGFLKDFFKVERN